jgi:hypothetical protein
MRTATAPTDVATRNWKVRHTERAASFRVAKVAT